MKHFITAWLLTLASSICLAQNYTLMTSEPSRVADGEKSTESFFVEITSEVFARSGIKLKVKEGHWIRNQKKVSKAPPQKALLITPLTRTEEREDSYDWILPLFNYKLQFITTDKSIDITNIDALRNLPVCALRESPAEYKLIKLGFTKIRTKVQEQKCFQGLNNKTVTVMLAYGKVAAGKGYKIIGKNPEQLIYGKSFSEQTAYLASTKKAVSDEDKKKIVDAFAAIKADGTFDKIFATY